MFKRIREDVRTVFEHDPAARSFLEVLLTYAGLHALLYYRLSHFFYRYKMFFIARVISQFARWVTLIEIHPGAKIGRKMFIDHGAGVVIGETCVIGDNVTIFQGVTLGGTGKETGDRHPKIGNNVLIAAGVKVLGNIKIGNNVKIGANSVVLKDVSDNSTVVGIPGKVVIREGVRVKQAFDHGNLPDPVADYLKSLEADIQTLKEQVAKLSDEQA